VIVRATTAAGPSEDPALAAAHDRRLILTGAREPLADVEGGVEWPNDSPPAPRKVQLPSRRKASKPALEIERRWAERHPGDMDLALNPTYALTGMGLALAKLGRDEEALQRYREALEIRRRLEKLDPQNARIRGRVANSLSRVANAEAQSGDKLSKQGYRVKAPRHWRTALDLFAQLEERSRLEEDNRATREGLRDLLAARAAP
jgi:tetratricopeptide (TPR) repeat protein